MWHIWVFFVKAIILYLSVFNGQAREWE